MWHTSRGDRTLRGEEAALVGAAIDAMMDALLVHVDVDDADEVSADCESGIDVYDRMTVCQRIGCLHEVAHFLLRDTDEPMPLSAASEATVAAIFVEIRDQTAVEIDLFGNAVDSQPEWRKMVLAAYRSVAPDRSDAFRGHWLEEADQDEEGIEFDNHVDRPALDVSPTCQDLAVWEDMIDGLSGVILWDRDFEIADRFLDIDPGVSHHRRKLLGISDDYFTAVAPDPRPDQAFELVSSTRALVRRKPR